MTLLAVLAGAVLLAGRLVRTIAEPAQAERPRPQVVLVGDPPREALPTNSFVGVRRAKPVKPRRRRALLRHLLEETAAARP